MDARLKQIVTKGPGIYFIVTDNSQIAEIEDESRLRIIFINSSEGPVNCLVKFAQYDYDSFTATFGKATRSKEKKGDFGHKVCLDALQGGPIGVINLRTFDDTRDLTQIASINPSTKITSSVREQKVPYGSLFNKNGYWVPRKENITEKYYEETGFLNFGNVSTDDVSIFVIKAPLSDVMSITEEYDETLENTSLEITDYPGLNWNTKLKDTFVKVYIFKNTFYNANANPNYGQYFTPGPYETVQVKLDDLDALANIPAASFVGSYVGSVIPDLVNENGIDISIDTIMYQDYMKTGVICDINNDMLETEITNNGMIDLFAFDSMIDDEGFFRPIKSFLSYDSYQYYFDNEENLIPAIPQNKEDNKPVSISQALKYGINDLTETTFETNVNTGLQIDDYIIGKNSLVQIKNIDLGEEITKTIQESIFYDTEDAYKSNIVYTNGRYFNINSHRWLTSLDCKNWEAIENDEMFSENGIRLLYESESNAVAVNGKIIAIATEDREVLTYVVVYENGNVYKYRIDDAPSEKLFNIKYNAGVYLIYCDNYCAYSNDGIHWNRVNKELLWVESVPGIPGCKFIGCDSTTYDIVYTSDGFTWETLAPDASAIAIDAQTKFPKQALFYDGDMIYLIRDGNSLYYIQKDLIYDGDAAWTGILYASNYSFSDFSELTPIIERSSSDMSQVVFLFNGTQNGNLVNIREIFDKDNTSMTEDTQEIPTSVKKTWLDVNGYSIGLGKGDTYYLITDTSEHTEETFELTYDLVYQLATYTCDGIVNSFSGHDDDDNYYSFVIKVNPYTQKGSSLLNNFVIESYKPAEAQFLNGTSQRQNEILNVMLSQGILKGLRGTTGLAYFIDAFKSFVEPEYKKQFGQLNNLMSESNRFTRAIINEPFINDLIKSTNPMFKTNPNDDTINYEYLPVGGNKIYSRTLLTKFPDSEGAGKCFFVGPGDTIKGVVKPISGLISNLFYNKTNVFDIAANETGYISGITELEEHFDENTDLKYLQKFRYNPVMRMNSGHTLYGNISGQKVVSKQQQWHNVELLCYIQENLYNMARPDVFKKGTYDEYLATQTTVEEFMNMLVVASAIKSGFVVKCDTENNTTEIQNYKIKLVHVEYTPYDCLEKVVFDININK